MKLRIERSIHSIVLVSVAVFLCALTFTQTTHAQSFLGGPSGASLIVSPQFPNPHTPIKVSLDAYSLDTTGASIVWYIDGVEDTQFRDARDISLETKGLGEKTSIRVVLTRTNAPTISSSISVVPAVVDIILEANTYTPSFYRGKALPSAESVFRAVAVVNDNTSISDTAYTYTWSLGDTVLLGGPIRGKNILEETMPRYDNKPLSVQVVNQNGDVIGKKSILLRAASPELHFYEQNPLRGLSSREAQNPLTLIGEETTIYGEPYFINTQMNERDATFSWKINGAEANHDASSPNAITLRHVGGEGNARVGFSIVTKTRIPQFIEKTFQIFFE